MNGNIPPLPGPEDTSSQLDAIDSAVEAGQSAAERLNRALGRIGVDIELLGNEAAIEKIQSENTGVDFDEIPPDPKTEEAIRDRLRQSVDDAIKAKRDTVLADYRERLARDELLDS